MAVKKNICLLILGVFLFSCENSNKEKLEESQSEVKPTEINIQSKESPENSGAFISRLKNVRYLPLETDSSYFIGSCSRVIFYDNKFIILDRKLSSVNVFNYQGQHLFNVGKVGSGPGEFLRLDDMDINLDDMSLLLWSNDNMSIFKYNLIDGSFLEKIKMPFFGSYFERFGKSQYIFYTDYNIHHDADARNVVVSDSKGAITKSYFSFPKDRETMAFGYSGFLSRNDHGYLYAHALSDTVYELLDGQSEFHSKYHFNMGSNAWTRHYSIFDHSAFQSKGFNYSVIFAPVFERNNFVFFKFLENSTIKQGFFNTGLNRIYTDDSFKAEDIDYRLFNIPVGMVNDTTFISVIYPDKFYELRDQNKKFNDILEIDNPTLLRILQEVKEENNPVLMIYSLSNK